MTLPDERIERTERDRCQEALKRIMDVADRHPTIRAEQLAHIARETLENKDD